MYVAVVTKNGKVLMMLNPRMVRRKILGVWELLPSHISWRNKKYYVHKELGYFYHNGKKTRYAIYPWGQGIYG